MPLLAWGPSNHRATKLHLATSFTRIAPVRWPCWRVVSLDRAECDRLIASALSGVQRLLSGVWCTVCFLKTSATGGVPFLHGRTSAGVQVPVAGVRGKEMVLYTMRGENNRSAGDSGLSPSPA
jgi:hypothetical protein